MSHSVESKNNLGLDKKDYQGGKSTLCTGCGHDLISGHIINACYQAGVHPFDLAKMSGIGCSSKLPAYFMSNSFGFNSMHGRMAPVATGAKLANKHLTMLGVSGDGDSVSIGLGGFAHMIRRNVQCVYIIANNGVYGLTKGQFSATADKGSKRKSGPENPFTGIDICSLAIELGASFVARSFSGDTKQMLPLLQAALKHQGTAVLDVISPCITFNNHDGSTKSYNYIKAHDISLQELGYVPEWIESEKLDLNEGETSEVSMADGSRLRIKKIDSRLHNLKDRNQATQVLRTARESGEVLTGLFYIDESQSCLSHQLNLTEAPLAQLSEEVLRPSKEALEQLMATFR